MGRRWPPEPDAEQAKRHHNRRVGLRLQEVRQGILPEERQAHGYESSGPASCRIALPATHKNDYREMQRVIFIGPKAQEVLRPYLLRAAGAHCFSPIESEQHRLAVRHAARKTPLCCGHTPGSNRKSMPKRSPRECYTSGSYNRAIQHGCELAFGMPKELRRASRKISPSQVQRLRDEEGDSAVERAEEERQRFLKLAAEWRAKNCWCANQLRHAAGTAVRRQYGLEAAPSRARPCQGRCYPGLC
jgi:hypothetical protein